MFRIILDRVRFEHQVGTYPHENEESTPPPPQGDTISISGEKVEIRTCFRYLGDIFDSHGDSSDVCKERARQSILAQALKLFHCAKRLILEKSHQQYVITLSLSLSA